MIIEGYKCFNKDKTNRYGMPFEEKTQYHVDGEISFGNNGNGFHMATHLSDVFRYFDTENDNFTVAKVIGWGEYAKRDLPDDFEGYYDMYCVSDIYIDSFLTREEIISTMLNQYENDVKKFLRTFKCTDEEIIEFINKYKKNIDIISIILYYHFGYKDTYYLENYEREERLTRTLIRE